MLCYGKPKKKSYFNGRAIMWGPAMKEKQLFFLFLFEALVKNYIHIT